MRDERSVHRTRPRRRPAAFTTRNVTISARCAGDQRRRSMRKHLLAPVHGRTNIRWGRAARPGIALRGLILMALLLSLISLTSLIGLTHPATVAAAGPDIVTNGGFELPAIGNPSFTQVATIPGWALSTGTLIEVQNHVAGLPFEGNQFVELDSNVSSAIFQNLATVAGTTYFLRFAF